MAYSLPPIAVTGEIITAAWGNDVRDALAFLKDEVDKPFAEDIGENRTTLNGTEAVDTTIERPALAGTDDEWGMVNFGDAANLIMPSKIWNRQANGTFHDVPISGVQGLSNGDLGGSNEFLYLGATEQSYAIEIEFSTPDGGSVVNLIVQYWNGSSWTSLANTDDTDSFQQDGSISWTVPADWAQNSVNGAGDYYWVRLRPSRSAIGSSVRWSSLTLRTVGEDRGQARDGAWRTVRLNDLHDSGICVPVAAGTALTVTNSMRFVIGDGIDMFLTVSTNSPVNLLLATSMTGVHSLPLSIKRITSA